MNKKKRARGRPVKYPMPEKIPNTPVNVLKAILATPDPKTTRGGEKTAHGRLAPIVLAIHWLRLVLSAAAGHAARA